MFDKVLLSEKVANNVKNLIIDNELQPGDKLPNEIQLSKILNVSRSTVREAIKILVSRNILEIKRGKGTFVCEKPGIATDPLGVTFMNKKDLLLYLFETRLIIEPEIAALAAKRATEKNVKALEEAFVKMKKDILEGKDHTETDMDFHNIIAKSSQNPIIKRIVPIINDSIKEGYLETKDIPESGEKVISYHEKVLEAIKNKDEKAARQHMKEHVENGMQEIRKK
ncbi:FadR/GntR family transcriptional regulator [Crassaminicella profunda]|uniref:FadR/GntR family transcriptional regulator n=1 Tax=Crassaminicella profunda TaxID=1286698 RepID=UPI001CA70603|nr:FadR/GntR family transcriptional regulator [Crassaminicella profunda]QZY54364.1 FadR family transcriptional regulator [Crassaminicella profunda]